MTLEATLPVQNYTYIGPHDYEFDFIALSAEDIKVTGIKDGVESEWEYLTDYTVILNTTGGVVTTLKASDAADKIRIIRKMDIKQPVDWVNGGPFDMNLLERNLDQIVMQIQQVQVALDLATLTTWKGSWTANTVYTDRDLVEHAGNVYFCLDAHTSSSNFDDDLAAKLWSVFVEVPDLSEIQSLADQADQSATNAAASASAASNSAAMASQQADNAVQSAQAAASSANAADQSELKASEWAQNPEDDPVEPGKYSAYHWAQKASVFDPANYYTKSDHIASSTGAADAGKPVVLSSSGKFDPTLVDIVGQLTYIGPFTPTGGAEYPDTTGRNPGSYWDITGVDEINGYTFTGGDLAGRTVHNGDFILYGESAWSISEHEDIDPTLYYRLDGTKAITAAFAGGNQQYHNLAAGTENNHAVNLEQLNNAVTPKADKSYVDSQDSALQDNIDLKADKSYVDSQDTALQANIDAKPDQADIDAGDAAITGKIDPFTQTATGTVPLYSGDCNDLNAYSLVLLNSSATNRPATTTLWYVLTVKYGSNLGQIAWSYNSLALFAYRYKYNNTWGAWEITPRMRADGDTLYIRDDGQAP